MLEYNVLAKGPNLIIPLRQIWVFVLLERVKGMLTWLICDSAAHKSNPVGYVALCQTFENIGNRLYHNSAPTFFPDMTLDGVTELSIIRTDLNEKHISFSTGVPSENEAMMDIDQSSEEVRQLCGCALTRVLCNNVNRIDEIND
jgi:hypothetical protein